MMAEALDTHDDFGFASRISFGRRFHVTHDGAYILRITQFSASLIIYQLDHFAMQEPSDNTSIDMCTG